MARKRKPKAKRKASPAATRSTNAELELRYETITDLICAGYTRAQIIRYAKEKMDWGVSDRQIDVYLAEVARRLAEAANVDRPTEAGKALRRLETLYSRALRVQDYKTCLAITREIVKFLQLDGPLRIALVRAAELSDDELTAIATTSHD